jgi:hypothetical protein
MLDICERRCRHLSLLFPMMPQTKSAWLTFYTLHAYLLSSSYSHHFDTVSLFLWRSKRALFVSTARRHYQNSMPWALEEAMQRLLAMDHFKLELTDDLTRQKLAAAEREKNLSLNLSVASSHTATKQNAETFMFPSSPQITIADSVHFCVSASPEKGSDLHLENCHQIDVFNSVIEPLGDHALIETDQLPLNLEKTPKASKVSGQKPASSSVNRKKGRQPKNLDTNLVLREAGALLASPKLKTPLSSKKRTTPKSNSAKQKSALKSLNSANIASKQKKSLTTSSTNKIISQSSSKLGKRTNDDHIFSFPDLHPESLSVQSLTSPLATKKRPRRPNLRRVSDDFEEPDPSFQKKSSNDMSVSGGDAFNGL